MSFDNPLNLPSLRFVASWRAACCEDRDCKDIHLVLFDRDDVPFAVMVVDSDAITELRRVHKNLVSEKASPNWNPPS